MQTDTSSGKNRAQYFGLEIVRYLLLLCLLLAGNAQEADVPHLYGWNNHISDETVARFEAQCSCKVVLDYYSDTRKRWLSWRQR